TGTVISRQLQSQPPSGDTPAARTSARGCRRARMPPLRDWIAVREPADLRAGRRTGVGECENEQGSARAALRLDDVQGHERRDEREQRDDQEREDVVDGVGAEEV